MIMVVYFSITIYNRWLKATDYNLEVSNDRMNLSQITKQNLPNDQTKESQITKWYISLDTIDSTISWHNLNILHRLRQNIALLFGII